MCRAGIAKLVRDTFIECEQNASLGFGGGYDLRVRCAAQPFLLDCVGGVS
jgi:hypothetical protein